MGTMSDVLALGVSGGPVGTIPDVLLWRSMVVLWVPCQTSCCGGQW